MAGFSVTSNSESDYCTSVAFELEGGEYNENIWCVKEREEAQYAAEYNTGWYNASYLTPINRFVGEWEVVELKIKEI